MTKAVLITGGKGERLRPLTYEVPKSLIPFHGRVLMDQAIDLFWKYQIYEIWLSLGWLANKMREHYPTMPFFVDFDDEKEMMANLGTGGWLNKISQQPNMKKHFNSDFYVANADNLFNLDLKKMMQYHKDEGFYITIACTKVPDVSQYGSVAIKEGKIQNFEEKKKSRVRKSGYINGGYYIFSPKVFPYMKALKKDKNEPVSLERDLFPLLAKDGKLGAFVSEGQWFDTGDFERWEKAMKEWQGITDA